MLIEETGGFHGVRDRSAVLVLEDLPRQQISDKELYPTLFLKAAVYARGIIQDHPFVDGNKRTGVVAASVFLENNGHRILAKEGEIENFALEIIEKKLDVEAIATWFETHSKKV